LSKRLQKVGVLVLKFVTVPLINVVLTITFCTAQGLPVESKGTPHFEEKIRPLLQRFCAQCHAPGEMGDIDFLALKTEADIANHRDLFASVVEQMQTRVMPPADFDQPSDAERQLVTDWITKKFDLKPKDIDRIATYVVEAYQDRKGHLWFGTVSNGAARYDGESLVWFSEKDGLPSNTVSSIAEDKDGNLWLGTHNGICKFDGKAFTVMWRTSGRHDQGEGWMSVFADHAGNIWTSTNKAVFRFDGTVFSEFKLPTIKEKVKSYGITAGKASLAMEDKKGNLWFKTDGNGAFKFDGKSFTQFTKQDGLCSNTVTAILEDKEGNIWFACMQSFQPQMTGDGGLCRYNGSSFTKFPEVKGLSENDIYTIYETKAGDLWIGATNVGAYRYDGKAFNLFDKTDRKIMTRHFGLQSILESRDGTLWFGFSGGLFRFNGQSFFNISKDGPWK
jgi:ligand-binding sensor domain-containing protein